ncbi:TraK family protein [Escherichia coli]|jgi:hypothetical protein|uniref:TraK family protein n=1 Tax=Enterobacteriaceae TaxID=543 RepID=UPI0005304E01|nr:TraK family protein [Escherichia coli]EKK6573912.1 TraK family protein [Salmonella enterica]EGD2135816.1 TraK family protein [Escherichia coli]EIX7312117.1 TraK family protein [Escherichia coli]HEG1970076.1 TraK family protein [Escherichia coli]HEK8422660.1 TraK family protein [Escherichia coli]
MGKDYLADLQEWVAQKKGLNSSSANTARVVFLAIRDDVRTAMEAGYSLTTIWEHMHETGRVTTTYETFRRHVKRYIREQKPAAPVIKQAQAAAKNERQKTGEPQSKTVIPEKTQVQRDTPSPTGSQLPAFHFKPPTKGTK